MQYIIIIIISRCPRPSGPGALNGGWKATSTHLGGDRAVGPPPSFLVCAPGTCICSLGGPFRWGRKEGIGPSAAPVDPGLRVGFARLAVPP